MYIRVFDFGRTRIFGPPRAKRLFLYSYIHIIIHYAAWRFGGRAYADDGPMIYVFPFARVSLPPPST